MTINITKDYRLKSDPLSWATEKRLINKKTNKAYWSILGYYNSVEQALEALTEYRIRVIKGSNLSKILEEIKALRAEVRGWGKKAGANG